MAGNRNSGRPANDRYKNTKMDVWRSRVKAGAIMNRLTRHIMGELEMSPTQVTAAQILLRKVLPDLAQLDNRVTGEMTQHFVRAPQKMAKDDWSRFLELKRQQPETIARELRAEAKLIEVKAKPINGSKTPSIQ